MENQLRLHIDVTEQEHSKKLSELNDQLKTIQTEQILINSRFQAERLLSDRKIELLESELE